MSEREGEKVNEIHLDVKLDGYPKVLASAEKLEEKLKEARTVAGELASFLEKLQVRVGEAGKLDKPKNI